MTPAFGDVGRFAWRIGATCTAAAAAAWATTAAWSPLAAGPDALAAAGHVPPAAMLASLTACALVVHAAGLPALTPLLVLALPLAAPSAPGAWTFAGPAGAVVWALTIADALWRGSNVTVGRRAETHPTVAPLAAAVVVLGTAAWSLAGVAMTGDAPHYLTATQSLVHDGDLDLRNDYDERTHRAFYGGRLEPRHTNVSPWGEEYPFHGLGVSVLVAPAYAWFGASGATASLVVTMSAGAWIVWLTVLRRTRNAPAAWFAWAALVVSAPYALHAAAIYPDGPAAVALAGTVWLLVRLDDDAPVGLLTLAAAGAGLAALPWLHVRLAVPAGVFGAAALYAIGRRQPDAWTRASWFLMVPIISCAGWLAAAYVMFGTWNPAAATLQRTAPNAWSAAPGGLLGLLSDQEFGLIAAAPVFLAAPLAMRAAWRHARVLAAAFVLCAALVMVMSSLWVWWGGDSAPARFLTVLMPALCVSLGFVWHEAGPGLRRALVAGLAISASLTWMLVTVDGGQHAYNFPDGRGSALEAASAAVDLGAAAPSLFRPGATARTEGPVAAAWALALLAGGFLLARAPRERFAPLGVMAALFALTASATAGWSLRGVTPWTPARAQLALLARLATTDVGVTGPRPRLIDADDLARRLTLRTPETAPGGGDWQLYLPEVPAGVYRLRTSRPPSESHPLTVELGRDAWPYLTWTTSGTAPSLRLATAVHSIRVPNRTAVEGQTTWLEPLEAPRATPLPPARRVTRFGDIDVYGLDDSSYPEPDGVWLGGNRTSSLVLSASGPRMLMATLTAGPAPVAVDVTRGDERHTVDLAAGVTQVVPLGPVGPDAPMLLGLTTRGGFPARLLREGDGRTLGAWLAVSAAPR